MQRQPRRVMRDYERLIKSGPESGIWIKPLSPDNMDAFVVMLRGPAGPYEGALFFFTLEPWVSFNANDNNNGFTYPASPPRILNVSPWSIRSHPNIYRTSDLKVENSLGGGAKVCLSILNTWTGPPWTPMLDFEMIFVTILSILDDNPLKNEPGYERGPENVCRDYAVYVQYCLARETMTKVFIPVLNGTCKSKYINCFANEICQIWSLDSQKYIDRMKKLEALHSRETINPSTAYYGDTSYVDQPYSFQDILTNIASIKTLEQDKPSDVPENR
jgi:ubiquitin-protein ligase